MPGCKPLCIVAVVLLVADCAGGRAREPIYSGTIEAVEVDVMPEVTGRILSRPVDQGDVIKTGDVIARIDAEPYHIALNETEAALAEAKAKLAQLLSGYRREEIAQATHALDAAAAQLTQAEARVTRIEELQDQKIATADDLDVARRDRDVAKARRESAQAQLALLVRGYRREEIDQAMAEVSRLDAVRDQRRLELERTILRSPVAGTVTEKLQEPGEYAKPGSPIVSVADLVSLYTWVYLAETDLPKVTIGEPVAVRVDGLPGRDFPGKVVYISKVAEFTPKNVQTVQDRVQLVFGVKVAVPNPGGELKVGLPADVILRQAAGQAAERGSSR
jgi:HlyD family secretion protein